MIFDTQQLKHTSITARLHHSSSRTHQKRIVQHSTTNNQYKPTQPNRNTNLNSGYNITV